MPAADEQRGAAAGELDPPPDRYCRRPLDVGRAGLAAVVLAVTAALARRDLSSWERDLYDAVAGLPDGLSVPLWVPMQLGTLGAVIVAALLAAWHWRRWRPPVGVLAAGGGGWYLAKVVKDAVGRGRPAEVLLVDVREAAAGMGFVSGHTTVAFALAAVLSPWVSARWRPVVWLLAVVVGLARIYMGAHLPLDVIGGAALGGLLGWTYSFLAGVPVSSRPARVAAPGPPAP